MRGKSKFRLETWIKGSKHTRKRKQRMFFIEDFPFAFIFEECVYLQLPPLLAKCFVGLPVWKQIEGKLHTKSV